MNQEM